MKKETIYKNQEIYTLILFILGSSFIVGTNSEAKQDAWISVLFAVLLFLPMIFVYIRICCLYPGKNIFDIVMEVCGNVLGHFVVFLYAFYSIHLGALVMRNFSEFITLTSLREGPQILILSAILVVCGLIVKKGFRAFARLNKFIFPIIACIVVVILVLSIPQFDLGFLKPIGRTGLKSIANNTLSVFAFPLAESVLVLSVYDSVDVSGHPYGTFVKGTMIAAVILLIISILNVCVLGVPNLISVDFPTYEVSRLLAFGEFFARFEVLIGISILLCGIVKISVCLFSATAGLSKLFHVKNREVMVYPAGLLMVTLAITVYKNTGEMFSWLDVYKYYALPFQVIFPLAIWIVSEAKRARKSRRKASAPGGKL